MSVFECEHLAQRYADWIRERVKVERIGEICVITAPFLDRHRDFLQVYVERNDSGLLLSDDGYVIRDLRISGLAFDTEHRREALDRVLRSCGIIEKDDELQVVATEATFAQKKHDLIQAMLAVGDLIALAQPTVLAVFKEDVKRYLAEKQVRFEPDIKLTGESGLNHSFDFVVPASQQRPGRYIKAIGTPDRTHIVELMFSWRDLQPVRPPNSTVYAVLNDEDRGIANDHLAALGKYGIEAMLWSDRDARVAALQD